MNEAVVVAVVFPAMDVVLVAVCSVSARRVARRRAGKLIRGGACLLRSATDRCH